MKPLLLVLSLFALYAAANAQGSSFRTAAIKEVVRQADSCYQAQGRNCDLLYQKALRQIKDPSKDDKGLVLYKLCLYYYMSDQPELMHRYLDHGLKQAINEDAREALLNLRSQVLYNEGRIDESIAVMVDLAKRLEKAAKWDKLGVVYANLGNQYAAQEDHDLSVAYLEKSYELFERIKDTVQIAVVAGNIADGHMSLGENSLARYWAYKTLDLPRTVKQDHGRFLAYITLARSFSSTHPDAALRYADKAESLAQKEKDKINLATVWGYKAQILKNIGKLSEAQILIEQTIALNKERNFLPGLAASYRDAAEISLGNKQYEKAALFYQEHIALSDSVRSEQRYKVLSEMTTRYETEKKERQLAEQALVIQQKNAEMRNWLIGGGALLFGMLLFAIQYKRSQQRKQKIRAQENENALLKAMMNGEERERNRISKDLHDGVAAMLGAAKMSLQSIPFLDEVDRAQQLEKVANLISNTHTDVRRIAHDLLPVTLEQEGLMAAIAQFAADINETGILDIQIHNELHASFQFPKNIELMLYRIVQELVNNIMRHASASEAHISFRRAGPELEIEVSDNGTGIGNNKEHQGLYSIRERLRSIGGNFDISDNKERGMRAILHVRSEQEEAAV